MTLWGFPLTKNKNMKNETVPEKEKKINVFITVKKKNKLQNWAYNFRFLWIILQINLQYGVFIILTHRQLESSICRMTYRYVNKHTCQLWKMCVESNRWLFI